MPIATFLFELKLLFAAFVEIQENGFDLIKDCLIIGDLWVVHDMPIKATCGLFAPPYIQSVGTKEGRDEKISRAMCMHKNYDYVLSPSKKTAKFYMEAFGCDNSKIKICSLPRVDDILTDNNAASRFFTENPGLSHDKIVLYLPTFRERDAYIAEQLKVEFRDIDGYRLIISAHPLFSKIKIENEFSYSGDFSTYDLMKIAEVIITDYSACAFEASVLMKPLYFFVPDYDEYSSERGINVDLKKEMPSATFENAEELVNAIKLNNYDFDMLYKFKCEYVENTKANNAEILAKFVSMLLKA